MQLVSEKDVPAKSISLAQFTRPAWPLRTVAAYLGSDTRDLACKAWLDECAGDLARRSYTH
jgi:hypothetical protein